MFQPREKLIIHEGFLVGALELHPHTMNIPIWQYLAGALGFEPRNAGIKIQCLTDLATPQIPISIINENLGGSSITKYLFEKFLMVMLTEK